MKQKSRLTAVSLVEMTVCVAMSAIILGALFFSSVTIQKSIHAGEVFASSYSDERRMIDYLGRDLRRSLTIAATDAAGAPCRAGTEPVKIDGAATLVLELPGYYKSNARKTADFDKPLDVVSAGDSVDYGSDRGFATPVQVTFRKVFLPGENCTCYVRREEGNDEIIVRNAQDLETQVAVSADGGKATVTASFHGTYSYARPLVATFDDLMLRNVSLEFLP
jgi:hypothetical protein